MQYALHPIELQSSKSKPLNEFRFVNHKCSFLLRLSLKAQYIACIDHFTQTPNRPPILDIDKASIDTSYEFRENIDRWQKLNLIFVRLAPLNFIEIVWQEIKYEWMRLSAYQTFQCLKANLFHILANIGKSFVVEFALLCNEFLHKYLQSTLQRD